MAALSEFFAMGGYAAFVWPAYGVAVVVLAGMVIESLRRVRTAEAELRALEDAMPRRSSRREGAGP